MHLELVIKTIFIILTSFLFFSTVYADHRKFCKPDFMELNDPPWEDEMLHLDPFAPWNSPIDSVFSPWNSFSSFSCTKKSINDYLKQGNYLKKYYWK